MADEKVSTSVDNNVYTGDDILGGDNIILYVGPKTKPTNGISLANPGGNESSNVMKLLGLAQGISIGTNRPQRQVTELGSKAKYVLSSRGQKQISISRLMCNQHNILKALYAGETSTGRPKGNIWLSTDHPLFKKPFGMLLRVVKYTDDGGIEDVGKKRYLENVTLGGVGMQANEGDRGIAENVTLMWSTTKKA